jgi:hypothetical protein
MEIKLKLKITGIFFGILSFLMIGSCKKKADVPTPPLTPPEKGLYVICEGNFNWGNASIAAYNENNNTLSNGYFEAVNGFNLGDVLQSVAETSDRYFIVMNNSSKIEVVDKKDFSSLYTITDLGSPRYFQTINDSIAYVSDLWNNAIHIINYNSGVLVSNISVNGWSEQMVKVEDSVYVCLTDNNSIGIINNLNNTLIDEIELNFHPQSVRLDKHNILWVLASDFNEASALYRINPSNRSIELEWEFSGNSTIKYIDLPAESDYLYLAYSSGLFTRITLTQNPVITSLFTLNTDGMYGFNINDMGEVYIMEAHDFVQNGTVSKYSDNGNLIYSFESGVNPNSIIFTEE